MKNFITVDVGNGTNTSLWFDSWRPQGPICTSSSARVISDSGLTKDAKVSAVILSGTWIWPAANSYELINLKEESGSLPPPDCSRQDKVLWDGASNFSIKRVWNSIRSPSQRVDWSHLVWFKYHVPRHSFILWLAIKGRLSTQDRLLSFGILDHMSCFLCQGPSEDHSHLFFSCPFSLRVWHSIASKCDLDHYPSSWERLRQWLSKILKRPSFQSSVCRLAFGASVYFIWHERNARKHGRPPTDENGIIIKIMDSVRIKLVGEKFPCSSANLQLIKRWQLSPSLLCYPPL